MADATTAVDSKMAAGNLVTCSAAAEALYSGTLGVYLAAGHVGNGGDDAGVTFAGVIADTVDNSGGSAGDLDVAVRQEGIFEFSKSSAVIADVGKAATIVDNQTVGLVGDTTNDVVCGTIVALVDSSTVKVKIQLGL